MYNRGSFTPYYVEIARGKGAGGGGVAEALAPAVPTLEPRGLRMSRSSLAAQVPIPTGSVGVRGARRPRRGAEELLASISLSRINELFSQNGPKMLGNGPSVIMHLSPLAA